MQHLPGVFGYDDTVIKIYAPEIADVSKRVVAIFSDFEEAGWSLGVSATAIHLCCARKGRLYSPTFDRKFAIRLSKSIPGEKMGFLSHFPKKQNLVV